MSVKAGGSEGGDPSTQIGSTSVSDHPQDADETTALLRKASSHDIEASTTSSKERPVRAIIDEFLILLRGSIPVILAYTLQNSLQTVSVLIVGRLSPEALATAAFAYMFAMASGWLIALGGTTAIDTFASVSFTGSKNRHDIGVILQRAFVVLGLFYVPVVVLWCVSQPLFRVPAKRSTSAEMQVASS